MSCQMGCAKVDHGWLAVLSWRQSSRENSFAATECAPAGVCLGNGACRVLGSRSTCSTPVPVNFLPPVTSRRAWRACHCHLILHSFPLSFTLDKSDRFCLKSMRPFFARFNLARKGGKQILYLELAIHSSWAIPSPYLRPMPLVACLLLFFKVSNSCHAVRSSLDS